MTQELRIIPLHHIGEIPSETDIAEVIHAALTNQKLQLEEHDILVVTQKIVSKAENRIVDLSTIKPSVLALEYAKESKKSAEEIELVLRESKRIVRMDHGIIIAETHQGFICANAGVDESNVGNKKTAILLPKDANVSAKKIQKSLINKNDITHLGIIISDTWGRPWREAQVNFAIGSYGIAPLTDYRGQKDIYGFALEASIIARADELAGAAELVMGKTDQIPVALIRGYQWTDSDDDAKALLRNASTDMFR